MRVGKFSLKLIILLFVFSQLTGSCRLLKPPINVVLVTQTPTETSLPTLTLPPTLTIYTATPTIFTATFTPTPTYLPLRIVSWKIKERNCNARTAKIELELEGGLSPYDYNINMTIDDRGFAHAVVVSADKQSAAVDIPVCGRDGGEPSVATPTPFDATATPLPGATATPLPGATATPLPGATATPLPGATATPLPVATATQPPVINTTVPPPPTITPDFPKRECSDNYDNDNDGFIDLADPQCKNKGDDNESQ